MTNPFDYLNAINQSKTNIIVDAESENGYNPFIVNRSLSYFEDTVMLANIMNQFHHIDKKMQFDFLMNTVRSKKRFSKWQKFVCPDTISTIKEYYNFSNSKAFDVVNLFNKNNIEEMKTAMHKGGKI